MINLFRKNSRNRFNICKPAVMVSLRSMGDLEKKSDNQGEDDLKITASKVFRAIGYPKNTSLLSQLTERIVDIKTSDVELKLKSCERTTSKVNEAFDLLFESLSESNGFAAIDEVQDLIRNDRLAQVGGQVIFRNLARLAVDYAVNLPTMQVAFAGSSNFLLFEFNRTVLGGERLNMKYVEDIQGDLVVKYLVEECNVPKERAADLVEQCGLRLRLILKCAFEERYLRQLDVINKVSLEHLKIFYKFVEKHHELHDALTKIAKGEIITLHDIPKELWQIEKFSYIIYVGIGSQLFFQNQIIEKLWEVHFQNKSL